jgi:putative transposase
MQIGAGDAPTFACADDCWTYLEYLSEASRGDGCEIHAYALAPSRTQLLVTGPVPGAVARMMRRVGLAYARHANARDGRRGACWRGRYLSCPVGGQRHILLTCAHVERSARHGPHTLHADHAWSSHAHNAHGRHDPLVSLHAAYVALGVSPDERLHRYRELVAQSHEIDEALDMHTRQGRAWGSERFLRRVATVLGEHRPARPRGRPRKKPKATDRLASFFLSPFLLTDWLAFVETL